MADQTPALARATEALVNDWQLTEEGAFNEALAAVSAALRDPDDPDWLARIDAEHRIAPALDPEDPFEGRRCTCGHVFVTTSHIDPLALFKHRAAARLAAMLGSDQ